MAHRFFGAFHKNLEEQYKPCGCPLCQSLRVELAKKEDENPLFKKILKTAEKAFKKLFDKGSYKPEDLFKTQEYKILIDETTQVFNSTISHEVTADLRKHLEYGNLVFSGLKTHAQLTEARQYLKDEKGDIVPFYKFQEKILKLNQAYNKNYLEAEYEFAVQSAQSVESWQTFSDDAERYWLEYRTAGDERVRADHDALRGVCLPKNDPFWESYYPPLGWRCRCTVVQVLASEKQLSDSKKARELGERATTQIGASGKNKLEMFRFNPALEKRLFPKDNGYAPKHCNGDKVNLTGLLGYSKIILSLENERCRAKKIIEKEAEKSLQAQLREKYLKEMEHLLDKSVYKEVENNKQIKVRFTKKGNKHLYSDTFGRADFDKEDLKELDKKLKNAEFIKSSEISKQRKDNIVKFHYFKDKDEEIYYNVAEEKFQKNNGEIYLNRFLYSITNKIK